MGIYWDIFYGFKQQTREYHRISWGYHEHILGLSQWSLLVSTPMYLLYTCIIHTYGYGSIPINTIFYGMNIHLPAILMFTRGTRLSTPIPWSDVVSSPTILWGWGMGCLYHSLSWTSAIPELQKGGLVWGLSQLVTKKSLGCQQPPTTTIFLKDILRESTTHGDLWKPPISNHVLVGARKAAKSVHNYKN